MTVNRQSAACPLWSYQPLVPVAIALATGIVLDRRYCLPFPAWLSIATSTLLAWCLVLVCTRSRLAVEAPPLRAWLTSLLLLASIVAAGGAWHHVYWHVYPANDIGHWCDRQSRPARLRAILTEEPLVIRAAPRDPLRAIPESTHTICQIRVTHVAGAGGWTAATGLAHLVVEGAVSCVRTGQIVEVLGEVISPTPVSNPGEFDYAGYLRGRRTRAIVRCDEPEAVWWTGQTGEAGIRKWLQMIAGGCERRLVTKLPQGEAEIAVALLLGRYELLEEDVTERYMRTGTMHILAISGQHLAILAGFLWFLLRFAPIPRKWGAVALGIVVMSYALLTGARPPVLRAAVLVCSLVGGIVLDARSRLANPLALALVVVLAVNPADLFDRGLQLSFLAVGALSWIVRPVWIWFQPEPDPLDLLVAKTRSRCVLILRTLGRGLAYACVMSGVVWLANVPLLAARFNLFSPIVVPLTVVLTPLATIALIAGLGLLVVDPWAETLGRVLGNVCGCCISWMDWCVQIGARFQPGYWYVPGPPDWWLTGFYVGMACILLFRPRGVARFRWAVAGAVWLAIGFGAPLSRQAPDELECGILSVGNGSAAILRLPGGGTVLVDAGQVTGPRVGSRVIAPALWDSGIRHIDAVIISHADVDHFNGVPHLADRFSIGTVFVPPQFASADQEAVRVVTAALARRAVPIRVCFGGDSLELGRGVRARVLHPPVHFGATDNEQSLVLLVEFKGQRILMPGDIEGAGLRQLLAAKPENVDILIAPHHGSRRANPPELATWCRPRLVVVSQGRPRSGATLDTYRRANIPVFTTNDCGAITLRFDGTDVSVQTMR